MLRILVLLLCLCASAEAQNLVMNPSFEEHYSCDYGLGNVWECKNVFDPTRSFLPATSDYFNLCMPGLAQTPYPFGGYQQPRTGNAYVGLFVTSSNYQEYVQIRLINNLVIDTEYDFSFYVNLSNLSRDASDDIHVKFVEDSIQFHVWPHELFSPDWVNTEGNYITDTVGWTRLSGTYIANGTEQWMIIGCFYGADNATTQLTYPGNFELAYYFIDDVVLKEDSIIIPNVFTPNNDGVNDHWTIQADVSEVRIYNRWGRKVFSSGSDFTGWNGNSVQGIPCSTGIYFYLLTTENGMNGATEQHKGFLTLIR